MECSPPPPAEYHTLVHDVCVQDSFQQPLLENLDSLAHGLRSTHVGPHGIMNVHVVRESLQKNFKMIVSGRVCWRDKAGCAGETRQGVLERHCAGHGVLERQERQAASRFDCGMPWSWRPA